MQTTRARTAEAGTRVDGGPQVASSGGGSSSRWTDLKKKEPCRIVRGFRKLFRRDKDGRDKEIKGNGVSNEGDIRIAAEGGQEVGGGGYDDLPPPYSFYDPAKQRRVH